MKDDRLNIRELKWIKAIRDHCIENRCFSIILRTRPLTALLYSEGGFYIGKRVMPEEDQERS